MIPTIQIFSPPFPPALVIHVNLFAEHLLQVLVYHTQHVQKQTQPLYFHLLSYPQVSTFPLNLLSVIDLILSKLSSVFLLLFPSVSNKLTLFDDSA